MIAFEMDLFGVGARRRVGKFKAFSVACGLALVTMPSCRPKPQTTEGMGSMPEQLPAEGEKPSLLYPYFASAPRRESIARGRHIIRLGMKKEEVRGILGVPDEINPTYEPKVKYGKIIGSSFVYLIARKTDRGSEAEKDERLLRVFFGMDEKVKRIDVKGDF